MFNHYKNQADVDAVIALAQTVFPDVKHTSCLMTGWNSDIVSVVGITVPQKGNKKKIDELVRLGFVVRGKRATNSRIDWHSCSVPYSFLVDLEYELPKFEEAV